MIERDTHPFFDALTGQRYRWSGRTNIDDDREPTCCYAGCGRPATQADGPRDWPPGWEYPEGPWYRDVCRRHEIEFQIGWWLGMVLFPLVLLYFLFEYVRSRFTTSNE